MNDILRLAGLLNEDDAYDHEAATAQADYEQKITQAMKTLAEQNGLDLDGPHAVYIEGDQIEITVMSPAEGVGLAAISAFAADWVNNITVSPGGQPDTLRLTLYRKNG